MQSFFQWRWKIIFQKSEIFKFKTFCPKMSCLKILGSKKMLTIIYDSGDTFSKNGIFNLPNSMKYELKRKQSFSLSIFKTCLENCADMFRRICSMFKYCFYFPYYLSTFIRGFLTVKQKIERKIFLGGLCSTSLTMKIHKKI